MEYTLLMGIVLVVFVFGFVCGGVTQRKDKK